MDRPGARSVATALLLCGCGVLVVWLVATRAAAATSVGAYLVHGMPGGDNAGPPIDAIVHGHFARLPQVQTVIGATSIFWRGLFVAVVTAFGSGVRLTYAVGAGACLLPAVGLVAWIARRQASWRQLGIAAIAGFVMIAGLPTMAAIQDGHPETVLTGLLVVAAVLTARADHRTTAALLFGLAVGSKETAVIAAPAVALALPSGRGRAALLAGAVALATSTPLALLDPTAFLRADASIGPITTVGSMSVWWPLATVGHQLPFGLERPLAAAIGLALASGIVSLLGRIRGVRPSPTPGEPRIDAVALLALCMLMRCLLDPADLPYYFTSMTIALAVWEAGIRRRWPIVSVCFWGVEAFCYLGTALGPPLISQAQTPGIDIFLVAALALGIYLAMASFPRRTTTMTVRVPDLSFTRLLAPIHTAVVDAALAEMGAAHPAPRSVVDGRHSMRVRRPRGRPRPVTQISARNAKIAELR